MKKIVEKFRLNTIVKLIICIVTISFCIGCNKLDEGIVIEKWYEPTQTNLMMMPITISNGKTFTTTYMPYYVTDSEDWCVKIKGKYNGKERIETVYLTKIMYDGLQVGDYLKLGDGCNTEDTNNSKRKQ